VSRITLEQKLDPPQEGSPRGLRGLRLNPISPSVSTL